MKSAADPEAGLQDQEQKALRSGCLKDPESRLRNGRPEKMDRGLFITLEGPDGSGKTTQIGNIAEYFRSKGREVVLTREPGGTEIGEKLRAILLDPQNAGMSAETEMMIYAAARAQHTAELIGPAIERGAVVICDRFVDSSVAYQAFGRGLGDMVKDVNKYAVADCVPDITFFLDIDPAVGRARIAAGRGEEDRMEQEALDFHYRVYDGYKSISAYEPERVIRIDADRDEDVVRDEIIGYLGEYESGTCIYNRGK